MAKIIKKYFFTLLVALSAISTALAYDCSANCVTCVARNRCPVCYKAFSISKGIDSACSTTPQPSSSHCLVYEGNDCVRCQLGYALNFQIHATCIPGTIQGCQQELLDNGKRICQACTGGYPSSDQSRCIPTNQIPNPISHCAVGGFYDGVRGCVQCESGYTTDRSTCFQTTPSLEGCILADIPRNQCQQCDYENGYFMLNTYSCVKVSALA